MSASQSYSFENTPNPLTYICTTGISKIEQSILALPPNIILQDRLTPRTHLLVAYKYTGTEKYMQALCWGIPIVSVRFLYDLSSNYKKYELRRFEGAIFSTSGIADGIYANYYSLLGAKYQPNCSAFVDFLVFESPDSEKYKFCKKYSIPAISTGDAFKSEYALYAKNVKYDAKQLGATGMFFGKIFFLDPKLPAGLFNRLRRIIIENEGTRVSALTDEIDYLFTMDFGKYAEHESKLYYYQYAFDCAESKALLFPESYKMNAPTGCQVLKDVIAAVDSSLGADAVEYMNKLRSLGAVVQGATDMRTTHYVSRQRPSRPQAARGSKAREEGCKLVLPEWVDQCLGALKHIRETKFTAGGPMLSLRKRQEPRQLAEEMLFQFTGLPAFLKQEMIAKLSKYGIKYSEASYYDGCTHLVMGQLNSSEKFFSSLVSGRWILRPDFIENFENQSNFDFSKYEWRVASDMGEKDKHKAAGIEKWRKRIQGGGSRPFARWAIKLYAPDDKLENYTKLIVHGGGRLTDKDDYTHVFVDKGFAGEVKEPNSHNADYLFSYLFK